MRSVRSNATGQRNAFAAGWSINGVLLDAALAWRQHLTVREGE